MSFPSPIGSFSPKIDPSLPLSPGTQTFKKTINRTSDAAAFLTPNTPPPKKTRVTQVKATHIPAPAALPMPNLVPFWKTDADKKTKAKEEPLQLPPPTPAKILRKKPVNKDENQVAATVNTQEKHARSLWGDDKAAAAEEKKAADQIRPPPAPKEESLFSLLHTALQEGTFTYNNSDCEVTKFDSGTYFDVYQLTKTPELLVKAHHGNTCHRFYPKDLRKLLGNSLQNYSDVAEKCALAVAELVNKDTAVTDGFFIQKKIPHKINISEPAHIEQVAKFFAASVTQGICMDLQPQNLRVTDEGTVVLIDFVEEPEPVSLYINKACRAWVDLCRNNNFTKDQGRSLLTTLTAGLLNSGQYTKAWLEEILTT